MTHIGDTLRGREGRGREGKGGEGGRGDNILHKNKTSKLKAHYWGILGEEMKVKSLIEHPFFSSNVSSAYGHAYIRTDVKIKLVEVASPQSRKGK